MRIFNIDISKVLPSQVEDFLRRAKRDLQKQKILGPWMRQFNRHTHAHPGQAPRKPIPVPPEFREPTAVERLAAVADPEIKEWVDAYDRFKAAGEKQMDAFKKAQKLHQNAQDEVNACYEKLKAIKRASNPEWEEWRSRQPQLDMRFNPLAQDEDFFLPARADGSGPSVRVLPAA